MKSCAKAVLPSGFKASGVSCGIKRSGKPDLALLYSVFPAKASCKFTANTIQAAPIKLSRKHLNKKQIFQAIIVNSGNANCFNGKEGLRDAFEVVRALAMDIGIDKEAVLAASTGIIGKRLPALKIKNAIPRLVQSLSPQGIDKAKEAILTTDTFAKEVAVKFKIANKIITICGIAKGAGMIAPNMATMLAFILTDANITQRALDKSLTLSVGSSFNCITVDGCMSTNDSVMVFANSASGNDLININNRNFELFNQALNIVCLTLAKLIIKDAEGATKFIQIKVDKAKDFLEARRAALSIANSNLFKTAIYGENPNFGRIAAAVGASGIKVREGALKIRVSPLNKKNINAYVSLGRGNSTATIYTSDLTPEYVKINAEYN